MGAGGLGRGIRSFSGPGMRKQLAGFLNIKEHGTVNTQILWLTNPVLSEVDPDRVIKLRFVFKLKS